MSAAVEPLPWPDVSECLGHPGGGTCSQCDGSHGHLWRLGPEKPTGRPVRPVRCRVCGARKCDRRQCHERRHHRGPHLGYDGSVREVGR